MTPIEFARFDEFLAAIEERDLAYEAQVNPPSADPIRNLRAERDAADV